MEKTLNTLFVIAIMGLAVPALSNLFNLIRSMLSKNE